MRALEIFASASLLKPPVHHFSQNQSQTMNKNDSNEVAANQIHRFLETRVDPLSEREKKFELKNV